MKTLHTQIIALPAVLIEKLFKLERQGRYAEALSYAKQLWNHIDTPPAVNDFPDEEKAEMLLRLGALIGFHGHNDQTPNAQINSKNLLTQARELFIDLNNHEKIAECDNYLALAFWRAGEFDDVKIWLDDSFSFNLPESNPVKLYTYIIQSLMNLSLQKYKENINLAEKIEKTLNLYGDAFLNGSFATNVAVAYEKLGNHQKNLQYLELARYYHQKSRHKIHLGIVENNLAQLYKLEKRFQQAHLSVDNAMKVFNQIKDRTREGFSIDTKAGIYLHELKFNDALKTVEKALKILSKTENKGYLVETMLTKVKALVNLDDISAATKCLFEAVEIAKIHSGEDTADNLIREFETALREKDSVKADQVQEIRETQEFEVETKETNSENELEFVLPSQLSHYNDIQVVKIQNTHLESVGLKQNSLAIVVKESIKSGELAVVSEKETKSVFCGFYECEFGIVCLESGESEPQLFDESEIEILGKIVGVCEMPTASGNKLFVQPLNL
ncbi:MAG TPA: hypothetical protein PKY59_00270 [Pyrinomonadaceae bacterium]|nr:hypothetical protein [Pyrinomonadaceae bacterium]